MSRKGKPQYNYIARNEYGTEYSFYADGWTVLAFITPLERQEYVNNHQEENYEILYMKDIEQILSKKRDKFKFEKIGDRLYKVT